MTAERTCMDCLNNFPIEQPNHHKTNVVGYLRLHCNHRLRCDDCARAVANAATKTPSHVARIKRDDEWAKRKASVARKARRQAYTDRMERLAEKARKARRETPH